jgi:hypothetical protein
LQIVRLQHEGVEFGEIEMLWRTNLQQQVCTAQRVAIVTDRQDFFPSMLKKIYLQLLRARRVTQAIPVRELHAPFVVKKVQDRIKPVFHVAWIFCTNLAPRFFF